MHHTIYSRIIMEGGRRAHGKIFKKAARALAATAAVVIIGQGIAEGEGPENKNWPMRPKPQGTEEPYVVPPTFSPVGTELLKKIDESLGRPEFSRVPNKNPSIETEIIQESLKPGDIAPETWGGAGIFDVMSVYVRDTEFTGQVVLLHKAGLGRFTYTLLAGRTATGEIVKGSNFKTGLDSISSTKELNLSLGGDGGAQLYYDQGAKELTFWMNGFPVGSPENPQGRRVSFVSQVKVDEGETGKSRVLHQPF